jgi:hypothetical protein
MLGILFEKLADQIVLNLSEEDLAVLEQKSRTDSLSLCDLLFDYITEYKQSFERQEIRLGGHKRSDSTNSADSARGTV